MKSKYNTGHPIDINKLTEEERKIAFHEWAEGSQALERLLNEGYKKGLLSYACCSGDTGKPYICYNLNDDNSRKIAIYIAKQLVESDLDCKVNFDNDFHYTEEEYKEMREHLLENFPEDFSAEKMSLTRSITGLNVQTENENREEVFDAMSNSIIEVELDKITLPQTEDEIPKKDFKNTREQLQTDSETKTENEFIADLVSNTYTSEEIVKNYNKTNESNTIEQPTLKSPEIEI